MQTMRPRLLKLDYFADKFILIWPLLVKIRVIIDRKLYFNKNYIISLWILDSSVVHCFLSYVLSNINFRGIATIVLA